MLPRDKLCGRVVAGSPICIHAESGIAKTEEERERGGAAAVKNKQSSQTKLSRLVLLHKEAVSNQTRDRNDLK